MEVWEAVVLGLVEGLTEYLPVSSTGHLLVVQGLLGIGGDPAANAFAIAIQAGAILAVLGLYRQRVARIGLGFLGKDPAGARLGGLLMLAFLPAAVFGLAFDEKIEEHLFGPWPIVAAWAAGGVLLLALRKRLTGGREGLGLEALSWRGALLVGFMQCLAMWPGTSRSLVTILGGLGVGLSLIAAVELSFLLGVITLGAATAYKALQQGDTMLEAYGAVPLLVGLLTAWVSAVIAVRWMVSWLERRGLGVFAWWRIAAAGIVAVLVLNGRL